MTNYPPYRPFRGAEPPHFVDPPEDGALGWARLTSSALAAYLHGPTDPRFHRLVTGEPTLGKSACLRQISRLAGQRLGWTVIPYKCRAKQDALSELAREVLIAPGGPPVFGAAHLARALAGQPWSYLKLVLEQRAQVEARQNSGLLIALDDIDFLGLGEQEALGHLAHQMSSSALPVAFLMSAGSLLAERFARAGNFASAIWTTTLERFDDQSSREALVVPATDRCVVFEEGALELVSALAGGSPLEVQRLGFAAWPAQRARRTVTVMDIEAAACLSQPQLVG